MQAPTTNGITQGEHGKYRAVDYSSAPDINIYAPEAGTITAYMNAGDCGNNLQMVGAKYTHGFCHLEKSYVKVGQKVKQGQKIGKMGYTGLTNPKGPNGRHLHWVLRIGNTYYYPPSKITKGSDVADATDVKYIYKYGPLKRTADAGGLKTFIGKKTSDIIKAHKDSAEGKKKAKAQADKDALIKKLKADLKKKPTEVEKIVTEYVDKVVEIDKTSEVALDTNSKVTAIFDYFSDRWATFRNFLGRK